MARVATISPVWGCGVEDLRALAREAEGAGFEAIFSPEVPPYSAISNAQVFAEATSSIKVGTWITNIFMRKPVICAAEALTVQEVSGGRMILGLGVSHKPVNDKFGIDMGNPVESMEDYIAQIRPILDGSSELLTIKRELPRIPVHIAGLTNSAAQLAGRAADGLMPYMSPPEYVRQLKERVAEGAKEAGRDPSAVEITNGIPSFVSDNLEDAVKAAKFGLSGYARFPFYQRLITNIGHGEVVEKIKGGEKPHEAFTDELIDAVALVGPAQRCRERLEAHREAGVSLPIIVPGAVGKQSNVEVMKVTCAAYG
ncbi:MAG: LLM class flavin-dependent oxidoreductase [Candidatus Dadabacteria bacterium]|nr:LLM class flavin-dependent oxidoreductase [Candidatus Dadabacteria bacterium]